MQMKEKLLIFGAGGHAAKVLSCTKTNEIETIGYISTEAAGTVINGLKVLGNIDYFLANSGLHTNKINIAIGENSVRYEIFSKLGKFSANLFTVVSANAYIAGSAEIQPGSSVMPGTVMHDFVKTGKCCIIDTGAIVEHHAAIGDFVNVSPGAILCGGARIETGAIIGAGSVVIEKINIGENSLIGAGSVVITNIPPNSIAVGNPARVIKTRSFKDRYLK
jgi:acetyltransferase EpsM